MDWHIDLFSGIGGFSHAIDQVYGGIEHVFCDNDPFCRQVIRKHWPDSIIFGDIRAVTADAIARAGRRSAGTGAPLFVTGGFPCQPFSHAGKRRGMGDDRYLWPEMLRVVRDAEPRWVIGENVAGIISLALEQVCSDLEAD